MSDVNLAGEGETWKVPDADKTPSGWKNCKKSNCAVWVRGPRTGVCPRCGSVIPKKDGTVAKAKPAKVEKPKGKPGRPRKVVVEVVTGPEIVPDPFTFQEVANEDNSHYKRGTVIRRALSVDPQPNNFAKVMKYLEGVEVTDRIVMQNVEEFAAAPAGV